MSRILSFKVGDKALSNKYIDDDSVRIFAAVSGDVNPIHLDDEYAGNTIFKKRIAHGMLLSSFISSCLANQLPGEGTIYLKQNLNFRKPAFIGDKISIELEILSLNLERKIMVIQTICRNQHGVILIDGEATVLVGD